MRIYISGKISGLPLNMVQERFDDAESLLSELGFDVVNPMKNGLDPNEKWIKHLCKDIELLDSCDAIYMMDNWVESRGARPRQGSVAHTECDIRSDRNALQ